MSLFAAAGNPRQTHCWHDAVPWLTDSRPVAPLPYCWPMKVPAAE
jgi:hypothetical protein